MEDSMGRVCREEGKSAKAVAFVDRACLAERCMQLE